MITKDNVPHSAQHAEIYIKALLDVKLEIAAHGYTKASEVTGAIDTLLEEFPGVCEDEQYALNAILDKMTGG